MAVDVSIPRQKSEDRPASPVRDTVVAPVGENDMAEEELRLMKELEASEKREAAAVAATWLLRLAALQDSQASEDPAFAEKLESENAAKKFRD